jgi:hypothetical protein
MPDAGKPSLEIDPPRGGFARDAAAGAVHDSGLMDWLRQRAPGPFGLTARSLTALEALVDAVDLGLLAAERLRALLLAELGGSGSFALPELSPEHRRLLAALQLVVTADAFAHGVRELRVAPAVSGGLDRDGLADLLDAEADAVDRAARVLRLARAYACLPASQARTGDPADVAAVRAVGAFFALLRTSVLDLARSTALRPLVAALESRTVRVAGRAYHGLEERAPASDRAGLLAVTPADIVGNDEYLQAGLRLARDVAAYDFERRRNPKRLNPILFGLGPPGCGKTATAHAVGNQFLDFCAQRGVPARFLVVRRTDWASSYQNASAANLVRLFREEVHGFDGVCGVYWADIDTAFASRESADLRQEEKQNLAAVFAVFDGTLLPRDGKWFLICDANTLHMDEATISRIAQNPFRLAGPTTAEHYVRLLRDVLLREVRTLLPADEAAWRRIGEEAVRLGLSGRNAESVCGNIRALIQDFEYPDAYFRADAAERERLVAGLGRTLDEAAVLAQLRHFAEFRRDAEARAEQERFDREVEAMVRQLNAGRAAAERALEPGEGAAG